ncbi:hypothetical protein EFA46_006290 [Halarchaeum sp. CBA1220]|uniref:hypothetical protein n=1 Tax=Halarchaeum sp. CBA1220 TaxID=1853682 RepID=UPI000F3AA74B|nr:hypothetical protein [Halarchaeum sp. CBA1220]QLC33823.1 hypothetical protein EFA46_006290 [Halarchaeum sp. CBA1220]
MPALLSALLDWDVQRATRVIASIVAVSLACRVTDELVLGLGVAIGLAMVLDSPWWLFNRDVTERDGE